MSDPKKSHYFLLLVLFILECTVPRNRQPGRLEDVLDLVKGGNRAIDGNSAARAFGVDKPDCIATSFDKILEHDDSVGCLSCASFDVTPISHCHFDVRTIYLTVNEPTRDRALARAERYVDLAMPASASKTVEELPAMERLVYRAGAESHEAHVRVSQAKSLWVASAVIFHYPAESKRVQHY